MTGSLQLAVIERLVMHNNQAIINKTECHREHTTYTHRLTTKLLHKQGSFKYRCENGLRQ